MKFFGLLLSLVVFLQYVILPQTVLAASVNFSSDASGAGGVQAEVPVNKIGALLLADATVFLNSTTLEVHGKGPDNGNQTLLNGTVLKTEAVGSGANRHIQGIAYFTGGSSLSNLCRKGSHADRVKTTSGQILEGAISGVAADGLTVQTTSGAQRIAANDLQCIDSSCAFEFDMALSGAASSGGGITGQASKISFSKCVVPAVVVKTSRVSSAKSTTTTHSRAVKVAVVLLLMCGIATAIAVPIAVSQHHHHNNNQQNLLAQQILLQQRSGSVTSQVSSTLQNPFSNSSFSP